MTRRQNVSWPSRDAFTVTQLMIVIAVVVTIVLICVPFLHEHWQRSRRTQSVNNLKEIGLAAHSFYDAKKRLPFNGSSGAVKDVPYSLDAKAASFESGSWAFQISSFMDQGPLFRAGTTNTGVAGLMCPGRGRPDCSGTPAVGALTPPWSDYVINPWLNDNVNGGGITTTSSAPDNRRTLVGITDGTSNTIFFGHGQINLADYGTTIATPGYMDTILIGGTTATALSSNSLAGKVTFARDSVDALNNAARGFGSPFQQGCLMCMGDATVRMFPYSIELGSFTNGIGSPMSSLATFLTPTGGETVTLCDN